MTPLDLGGKEQLYIDPSIEKIPQDAVIRLKKSGNSYSLQAEKRGITTWLKANIFCRSEYNLEKITQFFEKHAESIINKDEKGLLTKKLLHGLTYLKDKVAIKEIEKTNDLALVIFQLSLEKTATKGHLETMIELRKLPTQKPLKDSTQILKTASSDKTSPTDDSAFRSRIKNEIEEIRSLHLSLSLSEQLPLFEKLANRLKKEGVSEAKLQMVMDLLQPELLYSSKWSAYLILEKFQSLNEKIVQATMKEIFQKDDSSLRSEQVTLKSDGSPFTYVETNLWVDDWFGRGSAGLWGQDKDKPMPPLIKELAFESIIKKTENLTKNPEKQYPHIVFGGDLPPNFILPLAQELHQKGYHIVCNDKALSTNEIPHKNSNWFISVAPSERPQILEALKKGAENPQAVYEHNLPSFSKVKELLKDPKGVDIQKVKEFLIPFIEAPDPEKKLEAIQKLAVSMKKEIFSESEIQAFGIALSGVIQASPPYACYLIFEKFMPLGVAALTPILKNHLIEYGKIGCRTNNVEIDDTNTLNFAEVRLDPREWFGSDRHSLLGQDPANPKPLPPVIQEALLAVIAKKTAAISKEESVDFREIHLTQRDDVHLPLNYLLPIAKPLQQQGFYIVSDSETLDPKEIAYKEKGFIEWRNKDLREVLASSKTAKIKPKE